MADDSDGLNRLFHSICEGIKEGSHIGMIDEETAIVELPLSYSDGSPLTLSMREDGAQISDDGRTLLRLATDGRLSSKDDWEGAQGFWRIHSMKREGAELVFIGKEPHQFVRYLEGLRDLEFFASPNRDATKAFDAVVRKKVRSHLSARVKEGQLKKDVEERILNPSLAFEFNIGDSETPHLVQFVPKVDFQSGDGRQFFVILSHASKHPGDRMNHIKTKLSDVLLARKEGRVGATFAAVIPTEGYSGQDHDLIVLFTGSEPIALAKENVKPLVRRLLEEPGYFASDHQQGLVP